MHKTNQLTGYPHERFMKNCLTWIGNEFHVTYLLLRSNASLSISQFYVLLLARLLAFPSDMTVTPRLLVDLSVSAMAYGYTFDIINQTMSVDEDRINKPYRPIPAGLLSLKQAKVRLFLSVCLSPLIIGALAGPWAAFWIICWIAWVTFCYVWPKANNWFFRNAFSALGHIFLLRLMNEIVYSHFPIVNTRFDLDVVNAALAMVTVHVQEFHDVEGDRKSGRRTLPLLLSEKGVVVLRQVTATIFIISSGIILIWGFNICPAGGLLDVHFLGLLFAAASLLTAVRVTLGTPETKAWDENTYKFCYVSIFLFLDAYLVQLNRAVCQG
ncbi:hypothetical protein N7449_005282 [Penicillium cf. viridicatum]|uniref:Uncharacterized protein n=1 Tax=Penicillium cf. viridicatum TaxID=2972119 RepID=A0A9W9MKY9_9EURO|nr:hypothetical protein N7449_005282 [Penicillium cf. viridicatum]